MNNYFSSVIVSEFVQKGDPISVSLVNQYKLAENLSLQAPPSPCGDVHKIKFLCNSTVDYSWLQETLSQVFIHVLSFQTLYGELGAALKIQEKAKLAISRDNASYASTREEEVYIWHMIKEIYGLNPKQSRKAYKPISSSY